MFKTIKEIFSENFLHLIYGRTCQKVLHSKLGLTAFVASNCVILFLMALVGNWSINLSYLFDQVFLDL